MTKEEALNLINELTEKVKDAPPEMREYFLQYYTQAVTDLYSFQLSNNEQTNKPYNIGYFTGTFDMAHYGHLSTIVEASKQCEKLIVAVSKDELVKSYKPNGPVEPFLERLYHISNLRGVALAIPQESLYDKLEVCEKYGAEVVFTSGEYNKDNYQDLTQTSSKILKVINIWNNYEQQAEEKGIDIVYIDRIPSANGEELSSTNHKNTIVRNWLAQHTLPGSEQDINNIDYLQPCAGPMIYSEGECIEVDALTY